MRNKFLLFAFGIFFASAFASFAQESDMAISQDDLRILWGDESGPGDAKDGVHLYIKKKAGVESVMLVESVKDPAGKEDNFSYRAQTYNAINGDEIRYLNGKILVSKYATYSLVDSTPEENDQLGQCFHIYVPKEIVYGYPWTRNGTVTLGQGVFINIRTFEKKYCDYRGTFKDNSFTFDFLAEKSHHSIAETSFEEIANLGKGNITYSQGPATLKGDVISSLAKTSKDEKVDIVFAVDTTSSMSDDLVELYQNWIPALAKQYGEFADLRLGLLLFRDYTDDYNFNGLPVKYYGFTKSVEEMKKWIGEIYIEGGEGGDEPEAVYEALYASIKYFDWRNDAHKKIILIGDAQPHPSPRGEIKITKDMVISMANEKNITLDCIIIRDEEEDADTILVTTEKDQAIQTIINSVETSSEGGITGGEDASGGSGAIEGAASTEGPASSTASGSPSSAGGASSTEVPEK